ncbi:MAG: MATE family efflux transporter [Ignavibacteriaceae bacterium]
MTFKRASEHYGYKLLVIGTPIIIQHLMQYIQLQVDMALLGHYNPVLLSAVGNVLFPYNVLVSFIMATSLGATILIAHCYGSNELILAKRYSEVSFFYNMIISVLFFAGLYLFTPAILSQLGTPGEIESYTADYMRILSFSFLLLGVEFSITSTLQGMGITRHIMYAGIIRTVINVFFDWVLIYGYLGFPEMGIKGAALATTMSNYAAALYFIGVIIFSRRLRFNPSLSGIFNPEWRLQKENMRVGLPSGMESILWTFGQIAIIRMVNEIDTYSSGLYVLVGRIQAFTFFIYIGIARATMILVGQKLGADKPKEATKIAFLSLRYSLILCVIISTLFVTIPEEILSIFTGDEVLINRVSHLMYIIAIIIFPVAVNVIMGNAIRGMKDTKWMFYTQAAGTFFIVCMSALMIFVFHLNLLGIFLSILFDETFRASLNFTRFYKGREFILRILKPWKLLGKGV